MQQPHLTVYYDGLCHLCSREIDHYRRVPGGEDIQYVDITSPQFSAEREGVDPIQVHKEMHVRLKDGTLAVGVGAFIAIWEALPRYHLFARVGKWKIPHLILRAGYSVFAAVRPYLPRRKSACSESPYCDIKEKS
jgi:predicted DCC family thiol-disulfide oxidoreductase YuxK